MPVAALPEALVFIATSLDGYIARPDGDIDWLTSVGASDGGDYGYSAFMAEIDTLVMGRKTFEKVLTFGVWPYGQRRVVVLSSGEVAVPPDRTAHVEVLALDPAAVLKRLGAAGARRVYVDGGETIQRFLRAGLIGEMILTRIPILLGSGIPLFGSLERDVALQHLETRAFSNGLVQSRYRLADATLSSSTDLR